MVVTNKDGEYLLHERYRHPMYGYTGFLSGPVRWGETFEQTAHDEFKKQTGLDNPFTVVGMLRVRDFNEENQLYEDKLFIIMSSTADQADPHEWYAGVTKWYPLSKLEVQDNLFSNTLPVLKQIQQKRYYDF